MQLEQFISQNREINYFTYMKTLPVSVLFRASNNSKLEPKALMGGGWMANTDSQTERWMKRAR